MDLGDDQLDISQADVARLSPADQGELAQFLQKEGQKASMQKSIHGLTEMCFKKCIRGSISSGRLSGKEDSCMSNCVDRFMDTSTAVLKHLETMRAMQ